MKNAYQNETHAFIKYPIIGATYQHYKGGLYEVMTLAKDHNDQTVVVYKSKLFQSIHTRPLEQWEELVPTFLKNSETAVTVHRFEKM